jgi:hypothetical protein
LGRAVALHEEQAGGVEHGAMRVELFAEVPGLDAGVGATIAGDLARYKLAIDGVRAGDIPGGKDPEALHAITFLVEGGAALLAGEEGGGRPGAAPEDAGGIGAGDHGKR